MTDVHQTDNHDPVTSEVRTIGRMLCMLTDQEAIDLFRLIEHHRAQPSAIERRYQHLGLILKLIASTGEIPNSSTYDRAHEQARANGETWPDRGTLEHHYSSFEQARQAAIRLLRHGSASRVPSSYQHGSRRPANGTYAPNPCDPEENRGKMRIVADALIAFHTREGKWPADLQEYLDWAHYRRQEARDHGQPPPHYPGRREILKLFPDFQTALDFARAAAGEQAA